MNVSNEVIEISMADEPQKPDTQAGEGTPSPESKSSEPTPPAEKPVGEKPAVDKEAERAAKIAAAKAKADAAKAARAAAETGQSDAATPEKPAAAKPAVEAGAEKPKPKPPPKKEAVQTTFPITDDPFIDAIKARFPGAIQEALLIHKQQVLKVALDAIHTVLRYLKEEAEPDFNFLTDLTAVHYPERGFEVIYQLYAVDEMRRLRIKTDLPDGVSIPSVTELWSTSNWLEREVYDLFGIRFDHHPDLRRILLPEGWVGFPLRKEYPLEFEENEWVAKNLNILEIPEGTDLTGKFE